MVPKNSLEAVMSDMDFAYFICCNRQFGLVKVLKCCEKHYNLNQVLIAAISTLKSLGMLAPRTENDSTVYKSNLFSKEIFYKPRHATVVEVVWRF